MYLRYSSSFRQKLFNNFGLLFKIEIRKNVGWRGNNSEKNHHRPFLKYINTAIYLGICTSQLKIII